MTDIFALADYLLFLGYKNSKIDGEDAQSDITPLKLQKLLYYCQGYSLGLSGEPLFSDAIQAWDYGPVIQAVYNKYKQYGAHAVPFDGAEPDIGEDAKKIARIVMQDKGRFAPWALSGITHDEKPWAYTFNKLGRNSVISREIIQDFFASAFDGELPPDEEAEIFLNAGTIPTRAEWQEINSYVGSL